MTAEELFTRACRAYLLRTRYPNPGPVEPSFVASEVRPGVGAVLRSGGGEYLASYRWTGKRVRFVPVCADCGKPHPERYMVTDRVWGRQAGYRPDQVACLPCLVKRLGRPLRRGDFTPAPVNDAIRPPLAP